jgi:acyl transferase domain-containing protein
MDPVAVCGIGLRLPGGITTTDDFWDLLFNGRDARSSATDRLNAEGFSDALGARASIQNQNGYFLTEDPGKFDPSFFSMSRKEAERCDPQQRILLETVRDCLEDAGEVNYRGRKIGCYVGSFGSAWLRLQSVDPQQTSTHYTLGAEDAMIANRVSYEYDLLGPR